MTNDPAGGTRPWHLPGDAPFQADPAALRWGDAVVPVSDSPIRNRRSWPSNRPCAAAAPAVGPTLPIKGLLGAPAAPGRSLPPFLPVEALVAGPGEPGRGLPATALSASIRAFAHLAPTVLLSREGVNDPSRVAVFAAGGIPLGGATGAPGAAPRHSGPRVPEARRCQEEGAPSESLEREEVLDEEDRPQSDLTVPLPLRDGGGILTAGMRGNGPARALRHGAAGRGRAPEGWKLARQAEGPLMEPSSLIEAWVCRRPHDRNRNPVDVARTILARREDRLIPGGAVGDARPRRGGGRRVEREAIPGLDR